MSSFWFYLKDVVDFIFPNKEDLVKYDYTISQIIVAFCVTIFFFMWCAYRVHRFRNLPPGQGDPRNIVLWLIPFGVIRYMLPPETGTIFSLMIGIFFMLIIFGLQLIFVIGIFGYFISALRQGGDCLGIMFMGGGLAFSMVLLIIFFVDLDLYFIFSKKYY